MLFLAILLFLLINCELNEQRPFIPVPLSLKKGEMKA
jgi:hypothetical protein